MSKAHSNQKTFIFVVTICGFCALILSVLSLALKPYQERAKKIDQSKQLLIAAKVLDHEGYFILKKGGSYKKSVWNPQQKQLEIQKNARKAQEKEILALFETLVTPYLVDQEGKQFTFQEAGVNYQEYLKKHKKEGYANQRYKLVYFVYQKPSDTLPYSYVFPINGFGLWDAIYGYLAVATGADTVIGTTWYEQSETAGLGADIALPSWQKQFEGKKIFQKTDTSQSDFKRTPIGITVVKGKVSEVYPDSPKAWSAVDGITGASETGKGVAKAYRNSLNEYRPFLIKSREKWEQAR